MSQKEGGIAHVSTRTFQTIPSCVHLGRCNSDIHRSHLFNGSCCQTYMSVSEIYGTITWIPHSSGYSEDLDDLRYARLIRSNPLCESGALQPFRSRIDSVSERKEEPDPIAHIRPRSGFLHRSSCHYFCPIPVHKTQITVLHGLSLQIMSWISMYQIPNNMLGPNQSIGTEITRLLHIAAWMWESHIDQENKHALAWFSCSLKSISLNFRRIFFIRRHEQVPGTHVVVAPASSGLSNVSSCVFSNGKTYTDFV